MQQYQCIKQPKGFDKNFEKRFFNYQCERTMCLTSNPPQYKTYVELHCKDLEYYISIEKEEFEKCFVKYPYETNIEKEKAEMNKVQQHKELCDHINQVYKEKNEKYGDSFGISVRKYGLVAALTRISDKFNRFEQLILSRSEGTSDESLMDTCLDAANYFLMTAMELENQPKQKKPYVKPEMEIKNISYEDLEEMFKQSV